jgi:hypothetical protein
MAGKPGMAPVQGGVGSVGFPRRVCGEAVQVGGVRLALVNASQTQFAACSAPTTIRSRTMPRSEARGW